MAALWCQRTRDISSTRTLKQREIHNNSSVHLLQFTPNLHSGYVIQCILLRKTRKKKKQQRQRSLFGFFCIAENAMYRYEKHTHSRAHSTNASAEQWPKQSYRQRKYIDKRRISPIQSTQNCIIFLLLLTRSPSLSHSVSLGLHFTSHRNTSTNDANKGKSSS